MEDFEIDIATAPCCKSAKWRNRKMSWSEFAAKCRETRRTDETVAEYRKMGRDMQSAIKDVGGFVGGYLNGGVRKSDNVRYRSCATLDIDFGNEHIWENFTADHKCAAILYSTHKHTPDTPRYRLIVPFSHPVKPAEYEPICRRIAEWIGIDTVDPTSYRLPQLAFWPSTSKDGEYVCECQTGEPVDVDALLASYVDPMDASAWPMGSQEGTLREKRMRKAGDPHKKPSYIGGFCRAYTIEEAIEKFLPHIYEPTAKEGRYTYRFGSVAGGLVTYEGKFAYSHHSTDPASGMTLNAFDLVRVSLFHLKDEDKRKRLGLGEDIDVTRLPSYAAMMGLAAEDGRVKHELIKSDMERAGIDLEGIEESDTSWMSQLEYDPKSGKEHPVPKSTIQNMVLWIENDPALKGRIYLDLLRNNISVDGGLPWDPEAVHWSNRDDANLRGWLEKCGMSGKDKVKDALDMVVTKNKRHPIREYFASLPKWDGVPRLEKLIIDYAGADDSPLNRALTKIHFTAAVARVMEPGCKYDYCLILAGPQGAGKSTLISIMGGDYYKDGLTSMEGKEGPEQIQGVFLVEIGELDAMKRSEISAVKQFITTTADEYRPAYGQRKERIPRQCVFFGTTNERYFLKDDTGNRRFPIIPIIPELRKHGARWFDDLRERRDDLWAEALHYYNEGLELYLPDELEAEARERQKEYSDNQDDPVKDLLREFLEMLLPANWDTKDLQERRVYLNTPSSDFYVKEPGINPRTRFCIAEFLCEKMGVNMRDKDYKYMARRVGAYMADFEEWEKGTTSKHAAALYGTQKCYKRKPSDETEEEL